VVNHDGAAKADVLIHGQTIEAVAPGLTVRCASLHLRGRAGTGLAGPPI
jgi:hypothetical protein